MEYICKRPHKNGRIGGSEVTPGGGAGDQSISGELDKDFLHICLFRLAAGVTNAAFLRELVNSRHFLSLVAASELGSYSQSTLSAPTLNPKCCRITAAV